MKFVLALVALVAMLGFVSSTKAADPAKGNKPKIGQFVSIGEKGLTVKNAKGKEKTIKLDDNTKFTIDGKDVTRADAEKALKADEYIEVTSANHVATLVAASTTAPAAPAEPAPAAK